MTDRVYNWVERHTAGGGGDDTVGCRVPPRGGGFEMERESTSATDCLVGTFSRDETRVVMLLPLFPLSEKKFRR